MPFNMNPQQMAMMRQRYGQRMNMPTMTTQPAPMPQRTGGVGQFTNQPGMMPTRMAKGGSVSGASRGDGCAQRGKTKGRVV